MQSPLQEKKGWSKAMTSEILRNEECNPNLLKKKGLELLDAGKTNEAVECFSKGLVYAPFDSLMRFWRGRKLIGREEYTQSASDLKRRWKTRKTGNAGTIWAWRATSAACMKRRKSLMQTARR